MVPNGIIRAVYYDGSIYEGQATKSGRHGWGRLIYATRNQSELQEIKETLTDL